jgi:WD40 repeat protein
MMADFIGLIVALLAAVVAGGWYYFWFSASAASSSSSSSVAISKQQQAPQTAEEQQQQQQSSKSRNATISNKNKKNSSQKRKSGGVASKNLPAKAAVLPTHERFVRRFGGHTGTITCMAVSPNGEWIATAGVDGWIRVAQTAKGSALYVQTKVQNSNDASISGGGVVLFQDSISALSWHGDNRTLTCTLHHARQVAFYRIRKKAASAANDAFPYEVVELVKRRFSTTCKDMNTMDTCVTDTAHDSFCLVLTSSRLMSSFNAVAWNGTSGQAVGTLTIPNGNRACLSPDGRFICGSGGGGSNSSASGGVAQVKIFEVQRKKIKDQVELMFDKISPKSYRTIVATQGTKLVDVAFMGVDTGTTCIDKAVVACANGSLHVWSLNVEFHLQEDPKLLCTTEPDLLQSKSIVVLAAAHRGNRIAVVTQDDSLHILTFHASIASSISSSAPSSISLDCSIPNVQYVDTSNSSSGIGSSASIQFCPQTSRLVYTKSSSSKHVFCWDVE